MAQRVALVTGAGSGIGRATALALAREGARVAIVDCQEEAGQQTVALARKSGGEALFVRADVTRSDDVAASVAQTVATFGQIDCAFNNAGIEGTLGTIVDCSVENWEKVINTNLRSVFLCLKSEILQMSKQGHGIIVNNASVLGLTAIPGLPAYVASKHGIVGLTKAAALECAGLNIRVNAVCPGGIEGPLLDRMMRADPAAAQWAALHPVGRFGRPEEVAAAVTWLCSEAASFVTGHAMAVDGGYQAQ